jgi:hypothetical protein
MNMSMNLKRITISLPTYLYDQIVATVPERQISKFVSQSIEDKLLDKKRITYKTAKDIYVLRDSLPKFSSEDIKKAIEKGRK